MELDDFDNFGLRFRTHAVQRMFERSISKNNVSTVLSTGKVIEDYPDDDPYPSALILGWIGNRPIHVVAAINKDDGEYIAITVYEPDSDQWDQNFERRKNS
jgi:hypothetical protein